MTDSTADGTASAIRAALISRDPGEIPVNVVEGLLALAKAVTRVSHGDVHGPTGLEMLSMAVGGEGPFSQGLAGALRDGLSEIAAAIDRAGEAVAEAISAGAMDSRESRS